MRICFVNILYSKKDERGGLGAHIEDLSLELSKCGHEVTVITSGQAKTYKQHGVVVVSLGKVPKYSSPWQLLSPIYLFQRLSYMLRMTIYVLRSDFDIVEAAEGGAEQFFLVLFRNCSIITKLHGNFSHIYVSKIWLASLMERLEAFVVNRSDGIYTSSLSYAQSIANDYRIPLERIEIIPYGIDVDFLGNLRRLDLPQKYPVIKNKKLVLLSVGSSAERKGARVFLETASKFKQKDVLFILSCSDQRFLNGTKIPNNLLILPNLDRREFYDWISQADIVVFPSQFESFSIAVREAMLLNKTIVISSHIPLEGVDREYPNYSLLSEIDPALLANAIVKSMSGSRELPKISEDLHRRLRDKYDIQRVARLTVNFYNEVARKFQSRSRA